MRWRKACRVVAKIHQHIANQRRDFLHKLSTALVKEFGSIAVEKLNVKSLIENGHLGHLIGDAAWNMLYQFLDYKAERAGKIFKKVSATGTSQLCICGANVPKTLAARTHICQTCGITCERDEMSALVIEQKAFATPLIELKQRLGKDRRCFSF